MSWVWDFLLKHVGHLLAGLRDIAAGIVGKVFATFGLSLVTFNGILPSLQSFVQGYVSGLPASALQLLGALGVGTAMSMILSALTVRMAWKVFIVPKSVADSLGGGA